MERALEILGTPADVLVAHGVPIRARMARCPFHEDSSPSLSLYVSNGKQRWRCHGPCQIGGDAIDLEARFRGVEARELIQELAEGGRA